MGDIIEEHLNFNGQKDEITMIAWYHLYTNAFMTKILIIALYNMLVHNYVISRVNYSTFYSLSGKITTEWVASYYL